jgi:hypothetical protein
MLFTNFTTTVDEISGFNFISNPFAANTHICESGAGIFVCLSPEDGERFKYQPARKASSKETKYYNQWKEAGVVTGFESHLSWDGWDQW